MPTEPRQSNAPRDPDKKVVDEKLDDQLDDSFPASDPPSNTAPGHGATGAEVVRKEKK